MASGLCRAEGINLRSGDTESVPPRRDEVASLRVEDHVVISTADKDSLEQHGRQ
jgi:hypothetical protein